MRPLMQSNDINPRALLADPLRCEAEWGMEPSVTGANYDAIAQWYRESIPPTYGLAALDRALKFAATSGRALDVGCGSQGRFIERMIGHGFAAEGLDIAPAMIELARQASPNATFHVADICEWEAPGFYEFISAWDSTFHLPTDRQEPVLRKLCAALPPGGVLLFTCGGGEAGEISGSFAGRDFEYSTLGVEKFVEILADCGCFCRHVEYDQWPEKHVVVVAQNRP